MSASLVPLLCLLCLMVWPEAPVDTGLMALFEAADRPNTDHALETIVLHECLRRGAQMDYVRTATGYEVDFLATYYDRSQTLIQVCTDLHDGATLEREARALQEARLEYSKARCLLVTLEQALREPEIEGIAIVQAMDWLLDRQVDG